MYEDIAVLDVHGHVSVPQAANSLLVFMMGSNTPAASPIGKPPAGPFGVPVEDFRAAAQRHVTYLDERSIDVQVIGPRPFLSMGWMEEHLGFLTEQYLAGQFLSHGDVFERFPALKVLICHCGGALDRFIPTDPHLAQKDLSGNLFYDTCGYDTVFLDAAIKQKGAGRMCFGTEAPGSGRAVRPDTGRTCDDLVPLIGSFGFLSRADKVSIFHRNPARLIPQLAKTAAAGAAGR